MTSQLIASDRILEPCKSSKAARPGCQASNLPRWTGSQRANGAIGTLPSTAETARCLPADHARTSHGHARVPYPQVT
jgi:hypothetical protein